MQGPSQENPARKPSRPWGGMVFLVLTAVGVAAALHFHPAAEPRQSPLGLLKETGARNPAEKPASAPAFDMTQVPWSAGPELAGLKNLDQLPPDLNFPPGSVRLSLVQMQQAGMLQTKADYFYPGALKEARELMRQCLLKLGWQEAATTSRAASDSGETFYSPDKTLSLRCQSRGSGVKIVAVVAQEASTRPAQP